jgi:stage II sporulation protein R
LRKNLPLWLKILAVGMVMFFAASGWLLFFFTTEKAAAVSINKNNYIRLHILANSDAPEDQHLKLKVKDAVVAYLTPYVKDAASASEASQIIKEKQDGILKTAKSVLTENNAPLYPVTLELGQFDFPLKSYGTLILPAGDYQAVRLRIGEGNGQNWWCVLFPPLCFIDTNPPEKKDAPQSEIKILWKLSELFKG